MDQESNKDGGLGETDHSPEINSVFISKKSQLITCRQMQRDLIEELTKNDRWKVCSKKYEKQTLTSAIESMKSRSQHVKFIWAHWNEIPNILKVLPSEMNSLRILNIGGNNIQSLELLQTINIPKLQQLWLWNNKLVRVDCLRKNKLPKLKYIDISDNMITQCPKFFEMDAPQLERINIENNNFSSINFFMRNANTTSNIKILVDGNKMIKILKYYCVRGKKVLKRIREVTLNLKGTQIPVKYC